jgi:hypothetical protein
LLEVLIFTIQASGYKFRCAREEDDSGDIRLNKLVRLIGESPRSIHDLSRIDRGAGDLPRFNMPFELAMAMGARRFSSSLRNDRKKIMVREKYRLPEYLSDLGGNDPDAHEGDPRNVIGIVRQFLHRSPDGHILPGPRRSSLRRSPRLRPTYRTSREALITNPMKRTCAGTIPPLWCVAEFLARAD